jgi:hypothetical protein
MRRAPFDLGHFQYRLIRDAMNEAMPLYWLRRARDWDLAMPRAEDFLGRSTRDDAYDRAIRVRQITDACRHRAQVCELDQQEKNLILDMLAASLRAAA